MKTLRIIAAFAVGGIATSNFLAYVIPPAAIAPVMMPQVVEAQQKDDPTITPTAPATQDAPAKPERVASSTPESIATKISHYAAKYGVSAELMRAIISCETAGTFDPKIQSAATYTYSRPNVGIVKGERERSFGLAQIHLPDNPRISLAQATDPDFALNFMASELAAGNTWRWKVCYADSRS